VQSFFELDWRSCKEVPTFITLVHHEKPRASSDLVLGVTFGGSIPDGWHGPANIPYRLSVAAE
jgi:hypothetical protein